MYKVMIISQNDDLTEELQNLHIWGESSGFEIFGVVNGLKSAYCELRSKRYDLVICEAQDMGGWSF